MYEEEGGRRRGGGLSVLRRPPRAVVAQHQPTVERPARRADGAGRAPAANTTGAGHRIMLPPPSLASAGRPRAASINNDVLFCR